MKKLFSITLFMIVVSCMDVLGVKDVKNCEDCSQKLVNGKQVTMHYLCSHFDKNGKRVYSKTITTYPRRVFKNPSTPIKLPLFDTCKFSLHAEYVDKCNKYVGVLYRDNDVDKYAIVKLIKLVDYRQEIADILCQEHARVEELTGCRFESICVNSLEVINALKKYGVEIQVDENIKKLLNFEPK